MDEILSSPVGKRAADIAARCSAWPVPWLVAGAMGVLGLALARISLLNGVMLVGMSALAVGTLIEPLVGVGAALLVGPLWAWLRAFMPQVPPLIGQDIFFLAIYAWLIQGLLHRRVLLPAMPFTLPVLGFMLAGLLSLWHATDTWMGFLEWGKWGQVLLMALLVYDRLQLPHASRRVSWLLGAVALTAGFQALVGLWQFSGHCHVPSAFRIGGHFYRAYGTFEQPNPFAGFLGITGAILSGWLLGRVRGGDRSLLTWGIGLTVGSVLAALLASWSRGAWLGFAAASLVMLVLFPRRRTWGLLLGLGVIGLGLGAYLSGLLPPSLAARMTGFLSYTHFEDVRGVAINDVNFAVIERMAHWQAALAMWRTHFWLGVGLGCYEAAYPAYRLLNWPLPLGHAHNFYLNLLAETGLIGLSAYLWLLGDLWGRLAHAAERLSGWRWGLAVGLLGAWTHFAVHDLVDNLLVNNVHLLLGVMIALSAWLVSIVAGQDNLRG